MRIAIKCFLLVANFRSEEIDKLMLYNCMFVVWVWFNSVSIIDHSAPAKNGAQKAYNMRWIRIYFTFCDCDRVINQNDGGKKRKKGRKRREQNERKRKETEQKEKTHKISRLNSNIAVELVWKNSALIQNDYGCIFLPFYVFHKWLRLLLLLMWRDWSVRKTLEEKYMD